MFNMQPANAAILESQTVSSFFNSLLSISGELEQKALLRKILKAAAEFSEAKHGYLILEENGVLLIRAQGHYTYQNLIEIQDISLDEDDNLCKAME